MLLFAGHRESGRSQASFGNGHLPALSASLQSCRGGGICLQLSSKKYFLIPSVPRGLLVMLSIVRECFVVREKGEKESECHFCWAV